MIAMQASHPGCRRAMEPCAVCALLLQGVQPRAPAVAMRSERAQSKSVGLGCASMQLTGSLTTDLPCAVSGAERAVGRRAVATGAAELGAVTEPHFMS